MYKIRSKKFTILLTLIFVLTIMLPLVSPAGAATGYTAVRVPTNLVDNAAAAMATVTMELPPGALAVGDKVLISLPADYEFRAAGVPVAIQAAADFIPGGAGPNIFALPPTMGADTNALVASTLAVTVLKDNEIELELAAGAPTPGDKSFITFALGRIFVPSGAEGDVTLTFDPVPGGGFVAGSVVVGKVIDSKKVTLSVVDTQTFNDQGFVKFRLNENAATALKVGDTLKLTLPDGFEWATFTGAELATYAAYTPISANRMVVRSIWGSAVGVPGFTATGTGDDMLVLTTAATTAAATNYEFVAKIVVVDETKAKLGDVEAKVTGKSSYNVTKIKVGTYGEFAMEISADSAPNVFAGLTNQEIGKIVINESLAGSLVLNRTILLTLPENARWNLASLGNFSLHKGLNVTFEGLQGTDNRTARFKVSAVSTGNGAEIELEDVEVNLEAGKVGDLKVKVSGTAGLSGEITVAKILRPVSIASANAPSVVLGRSNQEIGDLTITESAAEAIQHAPAVTALTLRLPAGVTFSALPKVEVTEGDLRIDKNSITRADNNRNLTFNVERKSDAASKIKVSGIKITLDRNVPEGDIEVGVIGTAVVQTAATWPNSTTAAKTVAAVCGTPAPAETKMSAAFVIGSTSYTIGGVEATMDVAPYVKDGRTYLPVRYAGYALGVAEENIFWDNTTGTATLIKGDRVVQFTVGKKAVLINGAAIALDVAPEITNGRVMLPFRWIATAFGASVLWDGATQTVTMEL